VQERRACELAADDTTLQTPTVESARALSLLNCILMLLAVVATAASANAQHVLPPLPYAAEALDPAIDAETMRIHHERHHKAYVDNLNAALAGDPALAGLSIDMLQGPAGRAAPALRNNAGGHWNHSLFWQLMAPPGTGGAPSPELSTAITRDFGSLDSFKTAFNRAATNRFGSGWAWLIVRDGKLAVGSTPNQDNPLMDGVELKGVPILAVDVWEHAYYLKYQNRRADYLEAWWQVVNWPEVNRRFARAMENK
jgi:Fe-Mn family superoxide dismutase